MLLQILAKLTSKAAINDIDKQITANTTEIALKHKSQATALEKIRRKFAVEQEMVQNQMDNCDDKLSDEYKDLMAELKDLKEQQSKAEELENNKATEYQDRIDRENAMLEARRQAHSESLEGWNNSLKDDIQKTCATFANS